MKSIDAPLLTTSSETKKIKALALLSGGLDSHLAIKVVQEQGIEVEALNFITIFCNCTSRAGGCTHEASKASKSLCIKLKTINFSADLLQSVKQPTYGYGRNLNPCIDCRVTMFKEAKKYMDEIGADFLITGEVLDSRPMSQTKRNILFIENESGLEGSILRPLSAKDFKPTVAESKGWVDRDQFFGIKGRTRKRQIKLAEELGVIDYPCPAGGCLLTDPDFSCRLGDLMDNQSDSFDIEDVKLLKYGRHFRLSKKTKIVVGRDERDNSHIELLSKERDVVLKASETKGPTILVRSDLLLSEIKSDQSPRLSRSDDTLNELTEIAWKFAAIYGKGGRADQHEFRKFLIKHQNNYAKSKKHETAKTNTCDDRQKRRGVSP